MKQLFLATLLLITLSILVSPLSSFAKVNVNNHAKIDFGENITEMSVDNGSLWVATDNAGLLKVSRSTMDFNKAVSIDTKDGLLADSINGIANAFSKVFVATDIGISIVDGDNVTNYKKIDGVNLVDCQVTSNGNIVMITGINDNGGVVMYDGKTFKKIFFYADEVPNISSTLITENEFWIITKHATIFKISVNLLGSTTEWEIIQPQTSQLTLPLNITRMGVDDHGTLWLAMDKAIAYFDGDQLITKNVLNLHNSTISDLDINEEGFKYLATGKGLILMVNGREKKIDTSSGLSNNDVSSVLTDGDTIIISTKTSVDSFIKSEVEAEGAACLSCHTPGKNNGIHEHIDSEFPDIGDIRKNDDVNSGHKITYNSDADLTLAENNECLKCHGKLHPTGESIVINIDTGIGYARNSDKREFCLSCHDFSFEDNTPPITHQLRYIIPVNVSTYYKVNGHGANTSLSDGEASLANVDCMACHTHHASQNAYLIIKDAEYPMTGDELYNATKRDSFCKTRCHSTVTGNARRPVRDHTFEKNLKEARDHTGCPDEPCDTHPSNSIIPTSQYFKYPSPRLPLSGYTAFDSLNTGYVVCSTCHDVHGSDPKDEPHEDKQMLRLSWLEYNTLCVECHQ
jgi:hypothetical protein